MLSKRQRKKNRKSIFRIGGVWKTYFSFYLSGRQWKEPDKSIGEPSSFLKCCCGEEIILVESPSKFWMSIESTWILWFPHFTVPVGLSSLSGWSSLSPVFRKPGGWLLHLSRTTHLDHKSNATPEKKYVYLVAAMDSTPVPMNRSTAQLSLSIWKQE